MGKSSTLLKSSHKNQVEGTTVRVKASTINFLKQFARVYRVESKLNVGLSGLILN